MKALFGVCGAKSPTQSVGEGAAMPLQVTVTVVPRTTVVGLALRLAFDPVTVNAAVARRPNPLLPYRRNSYEPAGRLPGIGKGHDPAPCGEVGVCVQLTYLHSIYAVSAVPDA